MAFGTYWSDRSFNYPMDYRRKYDEKMEKYNCNTCIFCDWIRFCVFIWAIRYSFNIAINCRFLLYLTSFLRPGI